MEVLIVIAAVTLICYGLHRLDQPEFCKRHQRYHEDYGYNGQSACPECRADASPVNRMIKANKNRV